MNQDIYLIIHLMKLHQGGALTGSVWPAEHESEKHSMCFFCIVSLLRFMYISQRAADGDAFCLHTTSPEKLKKLQQ